MAEEVKQADLHQPWLIFGPLDENLDKVLGEGKKMIQKFPEIIVRIKGDMDARSLASKSERLADEQWKLTHNQPGLFEDIFPTGMPVATHLETGRPRLSAEAAYMFLLCRGMFGGLYTEKNWSRLVDSLTFRGHLWPYAKSFPSAQGVSDHLNSLSHDTLEFILQCQLAHTLDLELDDFSTLLIDSTHVHSHSDWPTDSGLILKNLHRAYTLGQNLNEFDLSNFRVFRCDGWLEDLRKLDFAINLTQGKKGKEFRNNYKAFLKVADKLLNRLGKEYDRIDDQVGAADMLPSRRKMLSRLWSTILDSLSDAYILSEVAYRRVVQGEEVKREDFEKIFSTSDKSAAFIKKGGRETVFGYRVQLNRSRNGFITGAIVPEGNVPDCDMLFPATLEHVSNTGVIPESVSTDDGYWSAKGRDEVRDLKVTNVSINGAKGRRHTPDEEWNSPEYAELRRIRSAVESLMFTGKFKFGFGQFSRCGLDAVRAEMLEKVLAYNFWRIGHEKAKRRESSLPCAG